MNPQKIRLAFGALFWRAFVVLAIALEFSLWKHLKPFAAGRKPAMRMLAWILYTPKMLFRAFLFAALFTVLIDLYVRFLMRPLLARYYSPKGPSVDFGTPLEFRLAAGETIRDQVPSRRVVGRRTEPGVLLRTDRRLWFSPYAWDAEPWSVEIRDVDRLTTRHPRSTFGSLLIGTPDRLVMNDAEGREFEFVLANPDEVLAWFPDRVVKPNEDYVPSPLQLQ